ncbi:uncharacterized protein [Vulpes vulpes]|uniref:Basic proline-rich protein-like n=1 Tax=Vulpes vulpes TaxID=9627 RepID=A0ABM5AF18_VULVU
MAGLPALAGKPFTPHHALTNSPKRGRLLRGLSVRPSQLQLTSLFLNLSQTFHRHSAFDGFRILSRSYITDNKAFTPADAPPGPTAARNRTPPRKQARLRDARAHVTTSGAHARRARALTPPAAPPPLRGPSAHTSHSRTLHPRPRDEAARFSLGLDSRGPCEPERPRSRAGLRSFSQRRPARRPFNSVGAADAWGPSGLRRVPPPPGTAAPVGPPSHAGPPAAHAPTPLGLTRSSLAAWTRKPGKVSHEGLEAGERRAGGRRRGCTCAEGRERRGGGSRYRLLAAGAGTCRGPGGWPLRAAGRPLLAGPRWRDGSAVRGAQHAERLPQDSPPRCVGPARLGKGEGWRASAASAALRRRPGHALLLGGAGVPPRPERRALRPSRERGAASGERRPGSASPFARGAPRRRLAARSRESSLLSGAAGSAGLKRPRSPPTSPACGPPRLPPTPRC